MLVQAAIEPLGFPGPLHRLGGRRPIAQGAVGPESFAKIMSKNAAKLYDFDLDQLASERIPAAAR